MIWAISSLAAGLGALWIARPFLRGRVVEPGGGEAAVSVYLDQADEVARDADRGLIGEEEATAALAEINRRKQQAARELSTGMAIARRAPQTAVLVAAVVVVLAIGGYARFGAPGAPDQPLEARAGEVLRQRADAGDISARIQLLIEKTEEQPESFETWWTLAKLHAAVGDHAASAAAYRQAVLLNGEDPAVLSAYAEAMTLANGNKVPSGAEIIFAQVARDADDPRALYYLALARAQRKDFEGAVEGWAALAKASRPDAPWMPLVRRDIVNMARFLGRDVTEYLTDATATEIALASGAVPDAPDPVQLWAAVEADPKDYKAWIALARAEAAAGDEKAAASALADARAQFQGAPFVLGKIAEAERSLGLDLVAEAAGGPTASDIAAAAEMTEEDRDSMIRGMVAGLAAKLEEAPDNPDGWTMLIRSYRTLGEEEKANAALARARALFEGTPAFQRILGNL